MERKDVYELIEFCNSAGHRMTMATCGYLMNDNTAKKLKSSGILTLSFSLDGSDAASHDSIRRTAGAFEITLVAIKKSSEHNIRFQINTTVTNRNIDHVSKIAQLTQELGAYCFNPFILVPTGRGAAISDEILKPAKYEKLLHDLTKIKNESPIDVRITCGPQFGRIMAQEDSKAFLRRRKFRGCMAGGEFAFISYRGDVQTCGFLNISAGNLIDNGYNFAEIWENSTLLSNIRDLSLYKGKCGKCEFVESCGGCRARAYAMTGNYLNSDPICNYKPKQLLSYNNENRNSDFDHYRESQEIVSKVMRLMQGEESISSLQDKATLPLISKNLIALGAAIAYQRELKVIEICVNNCLKSGASSQNIKDVLQQAILMAEMPIDIYTNIVNNSIKKHKSEK